MQRWGRGLSESPPVALRLQLQQTKVAAVFRRELAGTPPPPRPATRLCCIASGFGDAIICPAEHHHLSHVLQGRAPGQGQITSQREGGEAEGLRQLSSRRSWLAPPPSKRNVREQDWLVLAIPNEQQLAGSTGSCWARAWLLLRSLAGNKG